MIKSNQKQTGRKAQITLEFLTTYGWMFLVFLIVIGAFAYFGMLNPSNMAPSTCVMSPEIGCTDHLFYVNVSDGNRPYILLVLENRHPSRIIVTSFKAKNGEATPLNCSLDLNQKLLEGKRGQFLVPCEIGTGGFFSGEKNKADLDMKYYLEKEGPTYTKIIHGKIGGEVVEK